MTERRVCVLTAQGNGRVIVLVVCVVHGKGGIQEIRQTLQAFLAITALFSLYHKVNDVSWANTGGHCASVSTSIQPLWSLTEERQVPVLQKYVKTSWKQHLKLSVKYIHSARGLILDFQWVWNSWIYDDFTKYAINSELGNWSTKVHPNLAKTILMIYERVT